MRTKEKQHQYYLNNKKTRAIWEEKNKEKRKAFFKEYNSRESTKIAQRNSAYKNQYGIDYDEYNKILDEQQGKCSICGRHKTNFTKNLSVDHDHKTGKVRGIICQNCNRILGYAGDEIQLFENLIKYLKNNIEKTT